MTTVGALAYRVRPDPALHQLCVALRIDQIEGERLTVAIPTWVPGAYGFLRYGRDVIDLRAFDPDGRERPITRDGWSGFVVEHPPHSLELRYRAGAFDPSIGAFAGLVDSHQAVLLGTRYLHVPGYTGPVRVDYELPSAWPLHHPSGARRIGDTSWEYTSYAALLDTPVACGSFDKASFEVAGTPFHLVLLDDAPGLKAERRRLTAAVTAIARECHRLFGSFPFDDYTFVFSFEPANAWGLEHANATMIGLDPLTFLDDQHWCDAVRVIAHELFHAWNACRLKPHPLARPDFVNGSFTDGLWLTEGFTRWYEFLLCARAGLITPERLLANVWNYHRHLTALPAYSRVTAADSSRATFLNHHRFPGGVNTSIDYYDKGLLIAFNLDAALRRHGSSLDVEFRRFYERYVSSDTGFTTDDAIQLFGEMSSGIRAQLEREVSATAGLSTIDQLEALGFQVERGERRALGIVLKNGGAVVADVLDDGPAAKTGLAAGDEILRINDYSFHAKVLRYETDHAPAVRLHVRRGARTLDLVVEPAVMQDLTGLRWMGTSAQQDHIRRWIGPFSPAPGAAIDTGPYDNFHGIQTVL